MAPSDNQLVDAAIAAMAKAYAPYSNFRVGVALRDESGEMHVGVNVENAAYPVGNCAEASAIAAMVMAGGTKIVSIAVAGGDGSMLCTPCGACRQRIREFGDENTPILVASPDGLKASFTLGDLLPESFGPENLT